jgi:acyl carrier protein
MGGRLDAAQVRRVSQGGAALTSVEGLALLDAAVESGAAVVVANRLDLARLRREAVDVPVPALLRSLVRPARRAAGGESLIPGDALLQRLAGLGEVDRDRALLDVVRAQIAIVLGYERATDIDPDSGFLDLGFDSLTAVELRNRLNAATGCQLPATLIFDYPTPSTVAKRIGVVLRPDTGRHVGVDSSEADIRSALESIPVSRLRQSGLMDALLQLAHTADEGELRDAGEDADVFDEMDVDELVQRALHNSES